MRTGLSCVNCRNEVQGEGQFFAQVFLCPDCFRIAEALLNRGERELKMLLIVLKEAIRQELVQGRLQFSTIEQVEDVPKRDLMTHLSDLAQRTRYNKESKCSTSSPTPILSSESTVPSARSAKPKPV